MLRRAVTSVVAAAAVAALAVSASDAPSFAGYWWGHDRGLRISNSGVGYEFVNSSCCRREIGVRFHLSDVRADRAVATATWVRVYDATLPGPFPKVGDVVTIRVRDGVLSEPLTGSTYCVPDVDRCGL